MKAPVRSFFDEVNRQYGLYLDSLMGFSLVADRILYAQNRSISAMKARGQHATATLDHHDRLDFVHGNAAPWTSGAKALHVATQGELKMRNRRGGINCVAAAQMAIVTLYSYWEDEHRSQFARAVGAERKDLRVPIMGDFRLLRNSIIHHGGVALKDIERCEILKWFREGDVVAPSEAQMEHAFDEVGRFCKNFDGDFTQFVQTG